MKNQHNDNIYLLSSIKYPLFSDKTIKQRKNNCYTFAVQKSLRKNEIKKIFEKLFDIKIVSINTLIMPLKLKKLGKNIGTKPQYKKVILKLTQGQIIPNI
jgi:large subunit ribosomal protein L23